jgi:hypothetical protein
MLKLSDENQLVDLQDLNRFRIGDQVVIEASDKNDRFEGVIVGIELQRLYGSDHLVPSITLLHDGYLTDGFKPVDCRKINSDPPNHLERSVKIRREYAPGVPPSVCEDQTGQRDQDPTPSTHVVTVPRDRLLKLLEYADAEYVPNSLFDEFRGYLNTSSPQSNTGLDFEDLAHEILGELIDEMRSVADAVEIRDKIVTHVRRALAAPSPQTREKAE